jgi:hypothetical protein
VPPPPGEPQPVVKSASSFTINLLGSKPYRITAASAKLTFR